MPKITDLLENITITSTATNGEITSLTNRLRELDAIPVNVSSVAGHVTKHSSIDQFEATVRSLLKDMLSKMDDFIFNFTKGENIGICKFERQDVDDFGTSFTTVQQSTTAVVRNRFNVTNYGAFHNTTDDGQV